MFELLCLAERNPNLTVKPDSTIARKWNRGTASQLDEAGILARAFADAVLKATAADRVEGGALPLFFGEPLLRRTRSKQSLSRPTQLV